MCWNISLGMCKVYLLGQTHYIASVSKCEPFPRNMIWQSGRTLQQFRYWSLSGRTLIHGNNGYQSEINWSFSRKTLDMSGTDCYNLAVRGSAAGRLSLSMSTQRTDQHLTWLIWIKIISRAPEQKRKGGLVGRALCSVLTLWLRYQGLCLKLEDQSSASTTLKSRLVWRRWNKPNCWVIPRWNSAPAPTCWRPSSPSTSSSGNRRSGRGAMGAASHFLFLSWRGWTGSWLWWMLRLWGSLEAAVHRWWWRRALLNNPVLTSLLVKLLRIQMILEPPPSRLIWYPNRWKEKSRQPSNRDRRNTGKGSWKGWCFGGWRGKFSWLENLFRTFCSTIVKVLFIQNFK